MTGPAIARTALSLSAAALFWLAPAFAAERVQTPPVAELNDGCPGLVASPLLLRPRPVALSADQVRMTYVGHSTFLIESPKLVRIATDYNDYVRPPVLPDVITMNHAHSTHYTNNPDPSIAHVLRGWAREYGKPARHDVQIRDVRVRNVPTNIRNWSGGTEQHGNSIFIFEMANLCIAHLGHLHHTLTAQQLNEIGKVDVVLVPVDGSYTLDVDGMMEVLLALKAPLMIPMHYFSAHTLERFLDRARARFAVEFSDTPSVLISRTTLPAAPKLLVLPGR